MMETLRHYPDLVRSEGDGSYRVLCSCGWRSRPEDVQTFVHGHSYSPAMAVVHDWGLHLLRVCTDEPLEISVYDR